MLQSSISYSKQMITWYNIVVGLLVEGEGRRHDALEASDWMDAYSRSFSQPTSTADMRPSIEQSSCIHRAVPRARILIREASDGREVEERRVGRGERLRLATLDEGVERDKVDADGPHLGALLRGLLGLSSCSLLGGSVFCPRVFAVLNTFRRL